MNVGAKDFSPMRLPEKNEQSGNRRREARRQETGNKALCANVIARRYSRRGNPVFN